MIQVQVNRSLYVQSVKCLKIFTLFFLIFQFINEFAVQLLNCSFD